MASYISRRLIQAVLVVWLVTAIVFFAMRLMPGDPVLIYLSKEQYNTMTPEQVEKTRQKFGLDKPVIEQYFNWLGNTLRGDLGYSLTERIKVAKLIKERLPGTLYLGIIAFILGNLTGIAAGLICAVRRGKVIDLLVTLLANFGITIPTFWLAIMLLYVFSLQLGWLPTHGFTWPARDLALSLKQTIMPVVCLSIFSVGGMARQTRSVMLEVVRQDFIRTAYAKGLRERAVIFKHVFKNGMIPITTLAGMQFSTILGGSVIIETVFNISGMGRLAVDAIYSLDYAVTQAITLISAIMIVAVNLTVDVSYGWMDPRVRYQ